MKRYVIIGNGIAGISAAETIRALQPQGKITIISREEFPPVLSAHDQSGSGRDCRT